MAPDHAAETDLKITLAPRRFGRAGQKQAGQAWIEMSSRFRLLLCNGDCPGARCRNRRDPCPVSADGRRWVSRYKPRAFLLPQQVRHRLIPSIALRSMCGDLDYEGDGTPPGGSVAAAYLTAQSSHHGCLVAANAHTWWALFSVQTSQAAPRAAISHPYRARIAPQHPVRQPRNVVRNSTHAEVSKPPSPFPRKPPSLCSTGNREAKEQCGLGLVGQRRGSRPFLKRCVVEEAPAWLEVKAPLASYWPCSLHLLSQLRPISATITFKTGIWSAVPALPFASAIPLLPPAFHPRAWRPHLSIVTSTPSRRRSTRDPLSTFGDRSFLS